MLKALLKSGKFWITLFVLGLVGAVTLLAIDFWVMPDYTNYNKGITVPDVTKRSLAEAEQLLTDYGLRYEVIDRRSNTAYPADYILDQTPSASKIVKPNRKVYLTVNTAVQPTVEVPNVTNLSLRNARIQLQNYGLTVGTISYASSRFKNSVMRQSIPAGRTVDKGTTINLTVSDGLGVKKVPIPEIVGLRLPDAQQRLRTLGLRVGEIRFQPNKEYTPNTVLSYTPANKDSLIEGSTLDLIISERFTVEEESESGAVMADSTATETVQPDSLQQESDGQNESDDRNN